MTPRIWGIVLIVALLIAYVATLNFWATKEKLAQEERIDIRHARYVLGTTCYATTTGTAVFR